MIIFVPKEPNPNHDYVFGASGGVSYTKISSGNNLSDWDDEITPPYNGDGSSPEPKYT